jgi:hypothetical protein
VAGRSASQIVFVPGYHDGKAPLGEWAFTKVLVDYAWAASSDPDDDSAFLVVRRSADKLNIQERTGG